MMIPAHHTSRPNLLFLSPVLPAERGNGLAMRGALFLRALAGISNVYLHVVQLFPSIASRQGGSGLTSACAAITFQDVVGQEDPLYRMITKIKDPHHRLAALAEYRQPGLCRFATPGAIANIQERYAGVIFDAVHVFRLYLMPFAVPFVTAPSGPRLRCCLDVDDYESQTHQRFAELYARNGLEARAFLERAEAAKYRRLEEQYLPVLQAVYVAAESNRVQLAGRFPTGRFISVPNAVRLPPKAASECPRQLCTLVFVGTMGYYPNEDAMLFFCREVLPQLRQRSQHAFQLKIVGPAPSPAVLALGEIPGVSVTGWIEDLAAIYRAASVVIVPIRAGGGTRIKLLEAFAHRRPVVATSLGAEGLAVRHGEHLLIADTPTAFADACLHLIEHRDVAVALAERAHALVRSTYSQERMAALIRQAAAEACSPASSQPRLHPRSP